MKPREKRLLIALLSMLFLGAFVIGSDYYFKRRDFLVAENTNLGNEWLVIETLFEEKDLWEMRANWLNENQPLFTSNEEAEQAIYREGLAQEVEGVTTSKQTLLPILTTPDYIQAGVSLTASGKLQDVFRWIYDLNRPDSFHVIHNLKVIPDKEEPENIIAQFELLRWYAPPEA